MAIVCDRCKTNLVNVNGDICNDCISLDAESKIDRSYLENIYLPPDLFAKFERLCKQVESEKSGAKKAIGKFLNVFKTSFINKNTGKEINDPTPRVIIPKEKTMDRIQKILDHNLAVYASQNDMDTPEDLDDWSVPDMMSDDWEQSLFQHVESVTVMDQDQPTPASDSEVASETIIKPSPAEGQEDPPAQSEDN